MLRSTMEAVAVAGALLFGAAVPVLAQLPASDPSVKASPPLPDVTTFPVQLVLDDDTPDGAFGFAFATARQFLWFNRFTGLGAFTLEEIWVLFPAEPDVPLGGDVQLVVYQDPDGDPSNGADLLATYDQTIQAVDGDTFSVYPIAPLEITGGGDILIGVINRYFATGIDPPPTRPAAYDGTTPQGLSYFALWAGDPPDPPDLATADTVDVLAGAVEGNFMIRGFGTLGASAAAQIPTLGGAGLALLGMVLGLAGAVLVRRRLG